MLLTVKNSRADKTTGMAITYRAGSGNKFGTCPTSCELMHDGNTGSGKVDEEYYRAIRYSVPRGGIAWTYTHFDPFDFPIEAKTMTYTGPKCTINYSRPNVDSAARMQQAGKPCVTVVPPDYWDDKPSQKHIEVKTECTSFSDGGPVRGVRCPHEYIKDLNCRDCGNGKPLCAREDRDYFVIFTGHGARKDKCYAGQGHCNIHWQKLSKATSDISDAEVHKAFVKSLPPRTMLRPHIAGDMGDETQTSMTHEEFSILSDMEAI